MKEERGNSQSFIANETHVLLLDDMCTLYGKRPSEFIGIIDERVAYDFDLTVMLKARKVRAGDISQPDIIKNRQTAGFAAVKNVQQKVANIHRTNKK